VIARFCVDLEPRAKGRPRAALVRGLVRVYTPSRSAKFEASVAAAAAPHLPREVLEGPLRVDVAAITARPQRLCRKRDPLGLLWRPQTPDADNVRKAVLDALKAAWRDDRQVVAGDTLSLYAERHGRPRVVIAISRPAESPAQLVEDLGLDLGGPRD